MQRLRAEQTNEKDADKKRIWNYRGKVDVEKSK